MPRNHDHAKNAEGNGDADAQEGEEGLLLALETKADDAVLLQHVRQKGAIACVMCGGVRWSQAGELCSVGPPPTRNSGAIAFCACPDFHAQQDPPVPCL